MITSIFSKSKSINFIVVFFVTLLAFLKARFTLDASPINGFFIGKQLLFLLLCFATIFLLNFIVSKNSLTKLNSYEILLFSLFLLLIPAATLNTNILFANFFVLLGLRRIMSLRSERNEKKKLFDAAFWIAIASLFFFWAILFFVLIYITLALYSNKNFRYWLIPITGVATVYVLSVMFSIIFYNSYNEVVTIAPAFSYNFSVYNSIKFVIAITLIISFGIWSSVFYMQNIKKQKRSNRASFKIVIFASILSFIIVFQAPNKDGGEFLFLFAPLAIIITNYLETIKDNWFKEVFLSILIITPFILLLL